jgi:small redox-active disulfide protein 2
MEIKVLGPGCKNCQKLEEEVNEAVRETGVSVEIIKVKDMGQIMMAGIMRTPGLVINGKVKSFGRMPSTAEIKRWIEEEK